MAEITYEPTEWADFEQGGTPITAASLNHMEGGIAGAIRGVNTLTEDRLQTYRVSQDGDTATQDVSGNAIVGPCLIYDEAINGTYYEPSSDVGDRVLMVSANQIKALQDSVSQRVAFTDARGLSNVLVNKVNDGQFDIGFYVDGVRVRTLSIRDGGIGYYDMTDGIKSLWWLP